MARLNIPWRLVTQVSPQAVTTGEQATEQDQEKPAASAMRAEKPMMVYVLAEDETDKDVRKLEDVVFKSEKLAIGARFFDTIKIAQGDAMQDRILGDSGRTTPRIVFLARDYTVDSVLECSQLSTGRITRAMKGLVRKEYEDNFDRVVSNYGKLLNELDRLEARKSQIADMNARLKEKPNPSKAKKVERMEAEYNRDREAWEQREKELLAFQRRGEEKAQA